MIWTPDHQPSKQDKFNEWTRQHIQGIKFDLMAITSNLIAIKNLAKISDEEINSELKRMADQASEAIKKIDNGPTDK